MRMLCAADADIPLRLERIEPESEAVPSRSLNRGGGAKSRAVKVPDLRRRCLPSKLALCPQSYTDTVTKTYGLGIAARSSNED